MHYVFHKFDKEFLKCCRVCGRRLKSAKGVGGGLFLVAAIVSSSWKHFQLEYDTDTHLPEYYFACQGMIRRNISADKKDFPWGGGGGGGETPLVPSLDETPDILEVECGSWPNGRTRGSHSPS